MFYYGFFVGFFSSLLPLMYVCYLIKKAIGVKSDAMSGFIPTGHPVFSKRVVKRKPISHDDHKLWEKEQQKN